ncbi:MAG TPA: protein disulfide oxidoreductase [Sulfurimonas sp.]|nr:protein disulfide oxidoreductase [Sulfurimonas sp.]
MVSKKALKQRLRHWAKELAFMGLIIFLISNLMSYLRSPSLDNEGLPQISTFLINQEPFSTSTYEKKPILVHFWATWCPTCKLEASNIQYISDNYNVITIAVKSGSDVKINAYMQENTLNFKVINDEEGLLSQGFKVKAYPTSFIYNTKGQLSFTEVGYTSTLGLMIRMWWASF